MRLLDATRRPLLEAMTVRRGTRGGKLSPRFGIRFVATSNGSGGNERLIYKTLVLYRASPRSWLPLPWGNWTSTAAFRVWCSTPPMKRTGRGTRFPFALTWPLTSGSGLPKANAAQDRATIPFAKGDGARPTGPGPYRPTRPSFVSPPGLARILDRDLKLAGIPKRDERGRTVDVHAMRHTFGTWLSKGG